MTEHLIFGQITTGASDDLRRVHEISRSMVTQYGMGTSLMSRQLPAQDYSMSDATRHSIDEEQQFITDQAHRRALQPETTADGKTPREPTSASRTLALRVADDAYDELMKALAVDMAQRWHAVESDEERVQLDLSQVVYVRRDRGGQKVGF